MISIKITTITAEARKLLIEASFNLPADIMNARLNQAVADAYNDCYLRKSMVSDPLFERKNTSDNTPAVISTNFTSNPGLHLKVYLKGGGSENCSYLYMLNPSTGESEIISLVLDLVKNNVTRCCPPVIIGIGIGGSSSYVTKLALLASFRNLEARNQDKRYKGLEVKIIA